MHLTALPKVFLFVLMPAFFGGLADFGANFILGCAEEKKLEDSMWDLQIIQRMNEQPLVSRLVSGLEKEKRQLEMENYELREELERLKKKSFEQG